MISRINMSALTTEWLLGMLLLAMTILLLINRAARFYAKWTIFCVGSLFYGSVFIPIMLFRPRHSANALDIVNTREERPGVETLMAYRDTSDFVYQIFRTYLPLYIAAGRTVVMLSRLPAWGARTISRALGIKWILRGKQNLVQDSGAVVLLNHQSCLDLLCLAELWPVIDRCAVISKKEIFYIWPFGLASWLWGTIFIDRLNGEKAQSTVNSTAKHIRDKKTRLLMFPEGTRHGGEHLLPFKKGAFHVAIASQTPIQPVVVSRYYFLDGVTKTLDPGTVLINILPPIETKGLTTDDLASLIERTHNTMETEYQTINAEAATIKQSSKDSKLD